MRLEKGAIVVAAVIAAVALALAARHEPAKLGVGRENTAR
jgi:hypothetical protein